MLKIAKNIFICLLLATQFLMAECGPDCACGCQEGYPCCCGQDEYLQWLEEYYAFIDSPWYTAGGSWENLNCCMPGVWFPEEPMLFKPFLADPRQLCYSLGWRLDDRVLDKHVIDISFADTLALYEWCNVDIGPFCGGRLRIELEGGLWAVFSPCKESAPLDNADYYCGIPITYAIDRWAFRLRAYHISCHIGDEFLLLHPRFGRLNPSAEYLDFFVSHDLTNDIRVYGGVGWTFDQDESFEMSPFYAEAGVEVRLQELGNIDLCNCLYGTPFYAMHWRYRKDFKHHMDMTYVLGYEWGKLTGLARKVRAYFEYHDGYSLEGQFAKFPTKYVSFRLSYSY